MNSKKNINSERDLLLENYKNVKKKLEEERYTLEKEWNENNRPLHEQLNSSTIKTLSYGYHGIPLVILYKLKNYQ